MRKTPRTLLLPGLFLLTAASSPEFARWKSEASRVTITRDDWGIAHVRGRTDADAVFGMIYAQAEDDFPRIETNYLISLGRTAEADGEKAIWQDLRARLYVSEPELRADYARSPVAMRMLMDAWADGLNYFLATHRGVQPRVLTHFAPWMAMSFTEGSIGGDIERIDLDQLQAFYSGKSLASAPAPWVERQGSNGIAIAPKLTARGHALLLINPHTSYYFRSELQMSSDTGLNVYGAATWGQFFIYQGFNQHAGWMHTSSGIDNVDEFAERVEQHGSDLCYRFGASCRSLAVRPITIRYLATDGHLRSKTFMTYRTHRGPIVRSLGGSDCRPVPRLNFPACWVAFAMMDKPVEALQQSFLRTKASDLASYLRIAALKANSSNGTLFADDKGEIAYLHPQFAPRRDDRFDYTRLVDGSDPSTDWHGEHSLSELPSVLNPPNGWVQNTNAWPYRAAGPYSKAQANFPKYMDSDGENFRGLHAQQLLTGSGGWTLEKLEAAAYDSYQPGFAVLIPAVINAYDLLPRRDSRFDDLAGPIAALRAWNYRWRTDSIAQTLAILFGDSLVQELSPPPGEPKNRYMDRLTGDTTPEQKLIALRTAVTRLRRDFGRWEVPWGDYNRFQRLSDTIASQFSDARPSIAVPFADAKYGSLASLEMKGPQTTKRRYGNYGNSFVAVVEFGTRVRAKAVTAGGESGHEGSRHFDDEAQRYASGDLREVYFYPDELSGHTERIYHPGK